MTASRLDSTPLDPDIWWQQRQQKLLKLSAFSRFSILYYISFSNPYVSYSGNNICIAKQSRLFTRLFTNASRRRRATGSIARQQSCWRRDDDLESPVKRNQLDKFFQLDADLSADSKTTKCKKNYVVPGRPNTRLLSAWVGYGSDVVLGREQMVWGTKKVFSHWKNCTVWKRSTYLLTMCASAVLIGCFPGVAAACSESWWADARRQLTHSIAALALHSIATTST